MKIVENSEGSKIFYIHTSKEEKGHTQNETLSVNLVSTLIQFMYILLKKNQRNLWSLHFWL